MQNTKHQWEPTDNQGYAMQCQQCGENISFANNKEWNSKLHGTCKPTDA